MNNGVAYEDWLKINEFVSDHDAHAHIIICRKLIDKGFLEVERTGHDMGYINYTFKLKGMKADGKEANT